MSKLAGKSVKQAKREAKGNGKKRLTGPILLLLFLVVFGSTYLWSRIRSGAQAVSVEVVQPASDQPTLTGDDRPLRLAAYNIAHGRGPEPDASNWVDAERDRIERLKNIGRLLAERDIDVAVLNEVDFEAVWSGHLDHATIVADAGGYSYIARQRNYDVAVPFAKWRFGNAILSRYPISSAREVAFDPLSKWESIVWGNHDSLLADITLPDGNTVSIWAIHLESTDEATRIKAARRILERAEGIEQPLFVLGDFNSTPSTFPHVQLIDGVTAMDVLLDSGRFVSFSAVDAVPRPGDGLFTFPSVQPVRTIDWVLLPKDWHIVSGEVVQADFSDHLPVVVDVQADASDEAE